MISTRFCCAGRGYAGISTWRTRATTVVAIIIFQTREGNLRPSDRGKVYRVSEKTIRSSRLRCSPFKKLGRPLGSKDAKPRKQRKPQLEIKSSNKPNNPPLGGAAARRSAAWVAGRGAARNIAEGTGRRRGGRGRWGIEAARGGGGGVVVLRLCCLSVGGGGGGYLARARVLRQR